MLRIITLISAVILSSIFSFTFAAEAVEDAPVTNTSVLEFKNLKVSDSRTVRVLFSEDIDATSIVIKITKQADNSAVGIKEVNLVADTPDSVDVTLEEDLEEGTSYTMTLLAAVGISGSTITDGGSALKEFVTPSPLKMADAELNAPANPTAATIDKEVDTPVPEANTEEIPQKTIVDEPVPTEELPLTGVNTFLFLLVSLGAAFVLLRRKAL